MIGNNKIRSVLLDAKKAVGVAATLEAAAVGFGLLDSATAGYAMAAIGAVTTAITYALKNTPKAKPVSYAQVVASLKELASAGRGAAEATAALRGAVQGVTDAYGKLPPTVTTDVDKPEPDDESGK